MRKWKWENIYQMFLSCPGKVARFNKSKYMTPSNCDIWTYLWKKITCCLPEIWIQPDVLYFIWHPTQEHGHACQVYFLTLTLCPFWELNMTIPIVKKNSERFSIFSKVTQLARGKARVDTQAVWHQDQGSKFGGLPPIAWVTGTQVSLSERGCFRFSLAATVSFKKLLITPKYWYVKNEY